MDMPLRPTANPWQLAGTAITQGAGIYDNLRNAQIEDVNRQNVLQDLVARRTAAALEQARLQRESDQREWEFKQKQEDDAKQEKARADLMDLAKNGVKIPGGTETLPGKTETVTGPSPDMLDLQAGRPNALLGYKNTPSTAQVTTPDQTATTPDTYRPATMGDYQAAILPTTDPATFVKNLTPPNKAAAMSAVKAFILQAKAAGNKIIKNSDIDAAALSGDPTGAILIDKDYGQFKKTYATDTQSQNADTQKTNSETAIKRAGIAQQNADVYAQKVKDNKVVDTADPDNIKMIAQDLADGSLRIEKLPFLLGRSAKNSGARLAAYQMAKQINPDFDPSEYEKEFKMYENGGNQKALAQIAAVRPNIDTIMKMSADVPRLGMPAINNMILKGKYAIGNTPVTSLSEMQHALADEMGAALSRSGNFSDAKLALAKDLLHTDVSDENFQKNMELLKHMLDNNEKAIRAPMGHYGAPKPEAGSPPIPDNRASLLRKKYNY